MNDTKKKRGKPKGWKKQYLLENNHSAIEDVYGTGTSFNIFYRKGINFEWEFYKSAYSLESAKSKMADAEEYAKHLLKQKTKKV